VSLATAHFTLTFTVPPASNGKVMVPATQPGGSVWPGVTVEAVPTYTLRLRTRESDLNSK